MPARSNPPWFAVFAVVVAGAGLALVPPRLTDPLRTTVRDPTNPGRTNLDRIARFTREATARLRDDDGSRADEIQQLQSEVVSSRLRTRQLELERAQLQAEVSRLREQTLQPGNTGKPLQIPELIEARVLGEETAARWRARKILDRGAEAGVQDSAFVLEGTGSLIDQGETSGVGADQFVFAGRTIIGKTARVGRLTSTLRPVTDAGFRGKAVLGHRSQGGVDFGARGVFEGRGEALCRLTLVDATLPVRVGDDVYSDEYASTLRVPMYYGKVVRAELKPGATRWEVWVEPASRALELASVQVLRLKFNPARLSAH